MIILKLIILVRSLSLTSGLSVGIPGFEPGKTRTRICCVTITPYPNFPIKTPVLILTLQRYGFLFNPQIFEAFFC